MEWIAVILLFGITLGVRLFFAFGADHFTPDAYFHVRLVEHVREYWTPIFIDELSYGGRTLVVSPLFYYIIALLSFFFPLHFSLTFFPQLFMAFVPVLVFFIVRLLTSRGDAALFSASLSTFLPIVFSQTLFSLSPITLALPLALLFLLLFFYAQRRAFVTLFVIVIIALSLAHASSIVLVVGLLVYLLGAHLDGSQLQKADIELTLFFTFIFLWTQFLIYKRAFFSHGFALITQNIPSSLLSNYFVDVSLPPALLQVGVLPLIFGIYGVYRHLVQVKNRFVALYASLSMVLAVFLWFHLIEPAVGFMYIGLWLSILSGLVYVVFVDYLTHTKFVRLAFLGFHTLLIVLFLVSMVVPSIHFARAERTATISESLFDTLQWIQHHTPHNSTVLASLDDGHPITSIARRRNVLDDYFLLAPDAAQRLSDVERIFITPFPTEAVELLLRYHVNYLLVTPATRSTYSIPNTVRLSDNCLRRVHGSTNISLYELFCELEVTQS